MINFVSLTNNGYITFADNQIENFKKDYLKKHKLYLYCSDEDSYQYHLKKELPDNVILFKLNTEISGLHAYLQGRFKELMRLKFPLIVECINKLKTPVWFIDNDIIILEDPELYIDETKDILFQADMGDFPSRYGWVCTGCFWINDTANALQLLKNIIDLQSKIDKGEQEILNDYCKSWPPSANVPDLLKGDIRDFKDANLDILPYYKFQNGYLAFRNSETQYDKHECAMIHFNHESVYEKKIQNMELVKLLYDNK